MPLARIDMPAGKSAQYKRHVSDVIYEAIIEGLKAPAGDRFHVITEHQPDTLFIDRHFLGIERSDEAMIIQVTLRQGRSDEVKQAFFKFIADGLHASVDIRREDGTPVVAHLLSLTPFRRIVKDYFMICDSYYQAIRTATPDKIEAIDMGRRGIHDEGSRTLQERLEGKVRVDFDTARRLFTLISVLHWKG